MKASEAKSNWDYIKREFKNAKNKLQKEAIEMKSKNALRGELERMVRANEIEFL